MIQKYKNGRKNVEMPVVASVVVVCFCYSSHPYLRFFFIVTRRNSGPASLRVCRLFFSLPPTVRAFIYRENNTSALSSFLGSHRVVPSLGMICI